MRQNTKNKLVFLITMLLAGAVYVWFYPMNKGVLELNTQTDGYRVFIDGQELPCTKDPCRTKLQTGSHELLLQKEKHATVLQPFLIRRGETYVIQINLQRVYTLDPTNVVPKTDKPDLPLPKELQDNALAYAWNADGTKLIFLDKTDERVKIMADGSFRPVTILKNRTPPLDFYWSPNEIHLVVRQNRDLYLINTVEATRRKKVLDFSPTALSWSLSGDVLLLNDEAKMLYKLYGISPTNLQIPLTQSVWIDKNTLLFYISDPEKNRTDIKTYDPKTDRVVTLTVKFDFLTQRMTFDIKNNIAYFQKHNGEWYELKL